MTKTNVQVELVGQDGNAFAIIGRVRKALKQAKVSSELIEQFTSEATSGDYNHLLNVVCEWVEVDAPNNDDEDDEETRFMDEAGMGC